MPASASGGFFNTYTPTVLLRKTPCPLLVAILSTRGNTTQSTGIIMTINIQKQVNITSYGNIAKPQSDCVLLCLHGDQGANFLEENPFFSEISSTDPETLQEYLTLEQDAGTSEFTHQLAARLATHNFRVDLFESRIPRGIFDIGRWTADRAIRHVFDTAVHPELVQQFYEIHARMLKIYAKLLRQLSPSGIWVDIHSMAPFDPQSNNGHGPDPVAVAPGKLREYISAYVDPQKRGKRRCVNIATGLMEEPGAFLADRPLVEHIQKVFTAAGIASNLNDPHPMSYAITAAQLMRRYGRGLFVDLSKNLLCTGSVEQVASSLTQPVIDKEKVSSLASVISSGLVDFLKKD